MATPVSPVPVASYGRDPKVAEAVREKLMPDYDGKSLCPLSRLLTSPTANSSHKWCTRA